MIILRYSVTDGLDHVAKIFNDLRTLNFQDEEIICLQQDWDILFNCSTADLCHYKDMIEKAIHDKEVAEE